MSAVVSKSYSVVIRPSVPVKTTGDINLSPYDKDLITMPVTALLVFEHPIHEPVETIKRGLSQALVHYYPFSGRLAAGPGDGNDFHIKCTGEGVSFVAASASCALKDVKFFDGATRKTPLEELAMYYPAEGCRNTDPLLMMQVTEFTCGGFVVGVTWNHTIADGAGMGQFMQTVGELARGVSSSPAVAPVRWDDSLAVLPPSMVALKQALWSNLEPVDMTSLPEMALLDYTVSSSLVDHIKHRFRGHCNGQPCTVFEVVTAVLWQCRTRAIISDPDALTALVFTVNARKYMGAKDGYYGNCSATQVVMATSGTVANGDVMDVVKMIRRAKDQIPDQFNMQQKQQQPHQFGALLWYNLLIVTSWRNIGLDEADFGGGSPARVMSYTRQRIGFPVCVPCLPYKGTDGSNVFSLCVKAEHADAFLGELARFT